jgi:hypothetical protein
MRGFWMGLLVVIAVVVVIAVGSSVWLFWRINQETVTSLVVTNPGGRVGKALLVYQPGLTKFPEQVTTAFVSGLAAAGWQISRTTASREAPVPDAAYDLIIFGGPVYFEAPAKPLARYIARVGDLGAKPVVILLTGAGDVAGAIAATERIVIAAKGRPIRSLGFTTMKPNDEQGKYSGSNTERALQIASEAGQKLSPATQ